MIYATLSGNIRIRRAPGKHCSLTWIECPQNKSPSLCQKSNEPSGITVTDSSFTLDLNCFPLHFNFPLVQPTFVLEREKLLHREVFNSLCPPLLVFPQRASDRQSSIDLARVVNRQIQSERLIFLCTVAAGSSA